MSWAERLWVFAEAPVTIFMVDALQQLFFNSIFTNLLVSAHAFDNPRLSWTELAMCWAVLSTSVFEGVQLVLDGSHSLPILLGTRGLTSRV